ncbi:MAG TPA: hypothetical protein VNK50_05605 [Calidithermus sp.]|nr:hypothetical protein [Calidithermus sp.]
MTTTATTAMVLLAAAALAGPAAAGPGAPGTDRPGRDAVSDTAPIPGRVEGTVLALDVETGRLLLATDAGVLALQADPEDIARLRVGDVIEVVLVDDDGQDPEPEPGPRPANGLGRA